MLFPASEGPNVRRAHQALPRAWGGSRVHPHMGKGGHTTGGGSIRLGPASDEGLITQGNSQCIEDMGDHLMSYKPPEAGTTLGSIMLFATSIRDTL